MKGVNKVILLGHLGKDPEMRTFDDGSKLANFTLATNDVFKDQNGERQEKTEWHRVTVRGRMAEIAEQYLQKGKPVFVEGTLRTRQYQDKDGNTRYVTEVICLNFQMLGQPGGGSGGGNQSSGQSSGQSGQAASSAPADTGGDGGEDDLPF